MSHPDFAKRREDWIERYKVIMAPIPDDFLPPFREVNHRIPLIDEGLRYTTRAPKCPEAFMAQLQDKTNLYIKQGRWIPTTGRQAIPMLCIPKGSGKLRTVIDARQRNANTHLDVTPLPDQKMILSAFARFKYRTKIDMTDAYEQIRIDEKDVHKTIFANPLGTFLSTTIQIGDLNGPSTFQRLMTWVFRERLNKTIFVYIDDIFIGTNMLDEHEEHLQYVLDTLRRELLYISSQKFSPYAERVDALGHIIDDDGIHADIDKMAKIRSWVAPSDYNGVLRFLGLVEYVSAFMPDVSKWTSVLQGMCSGGRPFEWRAIHQKSFDEIRRTAIRAPILKPINWESNEPVWVVTDACPAGMGGYIGQGPDWKTCRPAAFMSKKFTTQQRHYYTYEHETLGVLECLIKWQDQLIGRRFTIITDHEALKFFDKKDHDSHRQTRWQTFMARFEYKIVYVPGPENKVADFLSRLYLSKDGPAHLPFDDYVSADIIIDRNGDDLTKERRLEYKAMTEWETIDAVPMMSVRKITDRKEIRDEEAEMLRSRQRSDDGTTKVSVPISGEELVQNEGSTTVGDTVQLPSESLRLKVETEDDFIKVVKQGLGKHALFSKVLANINQFDNFIIENELLYRKNHSGAHLLCVPDVILEGRKVTEFIIDHAHKVVGHFSSRITAEYIRGYYWWPSLVKEVQSFCRSCGVCQTTKPTNQKVPGLLHSLPVPNRPWQSIAMDFVGPFPPSKEGHNYVWVVLCRLSVRIHLVPLKTTTSASELAWMFLKEIVRLHGLPDSIISDRDSKFTSKFWQEVHRHLGVKLKMSTAFHPQTDGQSERAIRKASQVLTAMVLPDQSNVFECLPMTEFALNSSVNASTGFAPFEFEGYKPRMTIELPNAVFPGIQKFIDHVKETLLAAHDALVTARTFQTYHANKLRRDDPQLKLGALVYLATKNLALPKGRASKLLPKFIGPYAILSMDERKSVYELDLPDILRKRRIHPKFHITRIKPHNANDDAVFPHRDVSVYYDFGNDTEKEWNVESIIGHEWINNKSIRFHVRWELGDTTWEPLSICNELTAMDDYCVLLTGTTDWRKLPRANSGSRRR